MRPVTAALLSIALCSLGAAAPAADDAPAKPTGPSTPTTPSAPRAPAQPSSDAPARDGAGQRDRAAAAAAQRDRAAAAAGEFPATWFMGGPTQRAAHARLVGKPAPSIYVKDWRGEPQDLSKLKGKVVVIDFFGTWCGPCMKAVPENVAMVDKYRKDGLVFIGIHDHQRGVDRLDAAIQGKKINYPVAVDDAAKSQHNYALAFWPHYAIIDRKGVVRAAGLAPQYVEEVVKKLLAEPADGVKPPKDAKPAEGATPSKDGKATDKPADKPAAKEGDANMPIKPA